MRRINGLFWAATLIWVLPAVGLAQQPVRWQPTLESAKREATRTNRLVLIHFWAEWCGPCREMERDVFAQPEIAAAMQRNYVPVKVNVDHFPSTAREFGVTALPADIVITPQGRLVQKFQGRTTASQYLARLDQVAAGAQGPGVQGPRPGSYAQNQPAGAQPASANAPPPSGSSPGYQSSAPTADRYADRSANRRPQKPADRYADYYKDRTPASSNPAASNSQTGPPQVPAQAHSPQAHPPQSNPPLAMDGYCPVQLMDDMKTGRQQWTKGDRRWGAIHRGRTYLFVGQGQQQRFLQSPDQYAPVLSANDVVMAVEQGQSISGRREHGVTFGDRVYLFANEVSLDKFSRNPHPYANQALQAMSTGTFPGSRLR